MQQHLGAITLWTAALAIAAAVMLVVVKLTHRSVRRWRGVRSAHYLAAIGEIISRNMVPQSPPGGWATDSMFHDAISEYHLLVTGSEQKTIETLMDRLGLHDELLRRAHRRWAPAYRLQAISTLVNLADQRHIPDLRRLLHDRSRHVRVHAVTGLARLGDTASIGPTLDIATTTKQWESAQLIDALAGLGWKGVPSIIRWVAEHRITDDASTVVLAQAARCLGLIGDPTAEPTLIALLASKSTEVRMAAAAALETTGTSEAIPPLLKALDDQSWKVRVRAASALGALGASDAIDRLLDLLTDPVWWVRQNSAAALALVPGGTEALVGALDHSDRFAADAALNQLTESGAIGEALDRAAANRASEVDIRLLEVVEPR